MTFPNVDILVISIIISNHIVHRVLIDDDSAINILFTAVMVQKRIPSSKLTLIKTPFITCCIKHPFEMCFPLAKFHGDCYVIDL